MLYIIYGPVVQIADNAIQWTNSYPVDNCSDNILSYPMEKEKKLKHGKLWHLIFSCFFFLFFFFYKETPDGQQKIIYLIDASGSGDVDASTVAEAVNGCVTGLTGRKLMVCF